MKIRPLHLLFLINAFSLGLPGSMAHASDVKSHCSTAPTYASWYKVPPGSLAKRRAQLKELTAAHDRLPLGTLVRVTNLENHRTVVVRITDRGIHRRLVQIDVCEEAAQTLGMVRQGITRVNLEILPNTGFTAASRSSTAPAH